MNNEMYLIQSEDYIKHIDETLQAEADEIQSELQQEEKCGCKTLPCHCEEVYGHD